MQKLVGNKGIEDALNELNVGTAALLQALELGADQTVFRPLAHALHDRLAQMIKQLEVRQID